jgi:hypothetical protein
MGNSNRGTSDQYTDRRNVLSAVSKRTSCQNTPISVSTRDNKERRKGDLHWKAGLVQIQVVSARRGRLHQDMHVSTRSTGINLTSDTGASSSSSGLGDTGQDTGRDAGEILSGAQGCEGSGKSGENDGGLHFG